MHLGAEGGGISERTRRKRRSAGGLVKVLRPAQIGGQDAVQEELQIIIEGEFDFAGEGEQLPEQRRLPHCSVTIVGTQMITHTYFVGTQSGAQSSLKK